MSAPLKTSVTELEEVGNEYFDMGSNENLEVHSEDARPWLRRSDGGYDAIFVDAYRQPYIPFYLTTVEFFETAREKLRDGGVVIVNAGHPAGQDELERVLTAGMREVFPHVMRDPIEPTNTLLVASERPLSVERLRRISARALPKGLRQTGLAAAARVEAPLRGGEAYTDDRAPVEWLIDASIVEVAAKGER